MTRTALEFGPTQDAVRRIAGGANAAERSIGATAIGGWHDAGAAAENSADRAPVSLDLTEPAHSRGSCVRLSSPDATRVQTILSEPIAGCLAAAFGSGPWRQTPMPLGHAADRHSARGIVAELGPRALARLACADGGANRSDFVLGCVIGCILDQALVGRYGLEPFGATAGDGLFAYIGLRPSVQGARVSQTGNGGFAVRANAGRAGNGGAGIGLASLLFSSWLELPAIRRCPRVFIRTREILKPIQILAERNGFRCCGKFYLDFQGVRQDRLVYKRVLS